MHVSCVKHWNLHWQPRPDAPLLHFRDVNITLWSNDSNISWSTGISHIHVILLGIWTLSSWVLCKYIHQYSCSPRSSLCPGITCLYLCYFECIDLQYMWSLIWKTWSFKIKYYLHPLCRLPPQTYKPTIITSTISHKQVCLDGELDVWPSVHVVCEHFPSLFHCYFSSCQNRRVITSQPMSYRLGEWASCQTISVQLPKKPFGFYLAMESSIKMFY